MPTAYDVDLDRNPANYQPLTPIGFLERAAAVYPDRIAIVHGPLRRSYRDFHARARKLASALERRGIGRGDTVAVLLANTPAMLECHYGVPMTGAVLNTLNTRLDPPILAFSLDHGEAKVVIVDREFSQVMKTALAAAKAKPLVIDYDDPEFVGPGELIGALDYEAFLAEGDEGYERRYPTDEWDAISLNYTSGTTGNPKAWSITTAAPTCSRPAISSPAACQSIRSICGPCRCSTATAGASPGRSRPSLARMSACARCARERCTS
jgi:fatty-acyl-CoA synthase